MVLDYNIEVFSVLVVKTDGQKCRIIDLVLGEFMFALIKMGKRQHLPAAVVMFHPAQLLLRVITQVVKHNRIVIRS